VMNTFLSPQRLEENILDLIDHLVNTLNATPPMIVERWSLIRMFVKIVSAILWNETLDRREDIGRQVKQIISDLINELSASSQGLEFVETNWPAIEFATCASPIPNVPDYFGPGADLPINWASHSNKSSIESELLGYADSLMGSFPDVIEDLLAEAPHSVRSKCQILLDSRLSKRCLQTALLFKLQEDERRPDCRYVYLPAGLARDAINRVVSAFVERGRGGKSYSLSHLVPVADTAVFDLNFVESIDQPPQETPNLLREVVVSKRSFTDSTSPPNICDDKPVPATSVLPSKRRRTVANKERHVLSNNLSESLSFTKKLEGLLYGSESIDFMIGGGKSFLSAALKDAPALITEIDQSNKQTKS
jgi:hypothetical protein